MIEMHIVKTFTLSAGNTGLSETIDLGSTTLFAIEMPDAWQAAAITFLASSTKNGTFKSVYDDSGTEVTIASANISAGRFIVPDSVAIKLAPFRYLKLRSGTAATPVNQTVDRQFSIVAKA